MISKQDIVSIEKENWKKAEGVMFKKGYTNSALTPRDYSVECSNTKKIGIIKGYWIWWCSSHHQPYAWCMIDKLRKEKEDLRIKLEKINELSK